ncbi:MAG TPA: DUF4159 domain-containing protein [Pyrinomonadaceae bacterium]|jgi:hypothetical protein|nr:DUF4159 domain-containing protein [Pyrinomonadaceae bacterium]
MNRRKFVRHTLVAATAATAAATLKGKSFGKSPQPGAIIAPTAAAATARRPLSAVGGFTFARLRYASGNWDADPKMPSNLLNSLVEYTSVRVDPNERVVDVSSPNIADYPFLYMTGNKLVRFSETERVNLRRYLRNGGFLFVDDCNHDVDGTFAKTFETEIKAVLDRPEEALRKLPNTHPLYRAFFEFPDGAPATSHELNGWGDDLVHDYLKAIEIDGRISVLYSNKDYGCEWNYDWANKRFAAKDNTRFGVNIIVYALTH